MYARPASVPFSVPAIANAYGVLQHGYRSPVRRSRTVPANMASSSASISAQTPRTASKRARRRATKARTSAREAARAVDRAAVRCVERGGAEQEVEVARGHVEIK